MRFRELKALQSEIYMKYVKKTVDQYRSFLILEQASHIEPIYFKELKEIWRVKLCLWKSIMPRMRIMGGEVYFCVFIFPCKMEVSRWCLVPHVFPARPICLRTGLGARWSRKAHNAYSHIQINKAIKQIHCCEVMARSGGLQVASLLRKSKFHYSVRNRTPPKLILIQMNPNHMHNL